MEVSHTLRLDKDINPFDVIITTLYFVDAMAKVIAEMTGSEDAVHEFLECVSEMVIRRCDYEIEVRPEELMVILKQLGIDEKVREWLMK